MKKNSPLHLSSGKLSIWNTFSGRLYSAAEIILFLDYDGTITPIRNIPSEALLASDTKKLLQQLIELPGTKVIIVTGRSMEDIQKLILVENMGFVANHGFHMVRDGKEWVHPDAVSYCSALHRLHSILQNDLQQFHKAFVEDKRFTLSIHYRNVSIKEVPALKEIARKKIYSFDPKLIITEGKEVLEVRPPIDWGKGRAVMEVLKTLQHAERSLQIYIGDDITDENAFQILPQSAITIHVGKTSKTKAQYYVNGVEDVKQILKMIITLRTHRSNSNLTS